MSNHRSPVSTAWSIVWLLMAGGFALWFVARAVSEAWPWLIGAGILTACCWALFRLRRRRRDGL